MTALRDWATPSRQSAAVSTPGAESDLDRVQLLLGAERQRIAGALHDQVSQLLFGMTGRARRAQQVAADDPEALLATIRLLEQQLQEVQNRLREVITSCGPAVPIEAVPSATQRDLEDFTARTGIAAHLVVRGQVEHLTARVERVALNCLRQALFNIERHAGASIVVATLDYAEDRLRLVVQDDGLGLPAGFEPRAVPSDGHHWGFTSMAEQVERLGGSVELRRVEQGGTQLRVQVPLPAVATSEAS